MLYQGLLMMADEHNTLQDFRWVPIAGDWEQQGDTLVFTGGELEPPSDFPQQFADISQVVETIRRKPVRYGNILFNKRFGGGSIRLRAMFETVDHRSTVQIVIQHNVQTNALLTFGIGGGNRAPELGTGCFYTLWRSGLESGRSETQSLSNLPPKTVRTVLFQGGEGKNLKAGHAYDIEVQVQGSLIAGLIDGVEVMRYSVDSDVIGGQQFGILCGSLGRIDISNIVVKSERPKAFIVMQFNTPEYEALYKDVLQPVCEREGLIPYRGDSTYLPGLVIADIKKQIAESRIIIAEISPANANVYYEIGYADALNKPLILIANKNEGLKPFDVRAYRTIFYENSIGGKNKVESDLQSYLRSILAQ